MPVRLINRPGHMHSLTRITNWSLTVTAALPVAWLAGFYWLVLRTRSLVGHWPYYSHPDPKDTGFDLHYSIVMWGLLAFPVAGLAASLIGFALRRRTGGIPWWLVAAPLLLTVTTIVYLNIEPKHFVVWLLD